MKIDCKITTWESIEIQNKEDEEKVLKFLKETPDVTQMEVIDFLEEEGIAWEISRLDETDSFMTPKDNYGRRTIEVLEGAEYIWGNV